MARVMKAPGSLHRAVRLAVSLSLVSAVVIAGSPAYACSCAEPDLATWLTEADGAFIGRWVDRAEISGGMAAVTFEVEQVVKGAFRAEGDRPDERAGVGVRDGAAWRISDRVAPSTRLGRRLGVEPLSSWWRRRSSLRPGAVTRPTQRSLR